MPATPCNVRGQNANQPTTYQDAAQGLAFNPWGSVSRDTPGERGGDEKQRTQEKPKRTRRSSASPLPPTPTKLRASIKPTEKGQHLTKAFEHRKILHEQLRLEASRAQGSKDPGVPVKEEVAAREATPMQPFVASAVPSQTTETFLPFQESGWGWMPSSHITMSTQDREIGHCESEVFDQLLPSGSEQQATIQPSQSLYGISPGGPLLASPFQPQPKSSVLPRQGSDHLGLQVQDHNLESGPQSFGDRVANAPPIISLARGEDIPATPDFHARIEASPSARGDAEATSRPPRGVAEPTFSRDLAEDSQSFSSDANTLDRRETVQLAADRSSPVSGQSSRPPKTMGTPSDEPEPRSTNFSAADSSSQVGLQRSCAVDFFLLYRHYFFTQTEEELRRIPNEKFNFDKQDIPDDVVKKAYEIFKSATPEYETFLLDTWSIDRMMSSGRDSDGRSELFDKYVIKLKNIYRFASTLLHFETASCIVGHEIHKDQALSTSVCSPMVPNFFADRLGVSESDITGHLQAYAYDYVSKQTLPNIVRAGPDHQDGYIGTSITPIGSRSAKDEPDALTVKAACPSDRQTVATGMTETTPTPDEPVEEIGDVEKKKKSASKKDQDRLRELKRLLFILTEHCHIKQLSTVKAIQLTKLPQILAARGWVIENWPEDLPFACDCKTGKGVAGLSAQEQIALLKALKDPHFPIRVVKKYETSVPISEPVIIGVPPHPESTYTHGRRRFLDPGNTSDRNGPLRLGLRQDGQSSERSTEARPPLATPDMARMGLPKRPLVDEGLSADERWSKKSKRVTFLEDTPECDSVVRNQSSQFFQDKPVLDSALDANKRSELGLKGSQAKVPMSMLRPEDDNVPLCSAGSDERGRRYTAAEETCSQEFNLAKQPAEGGLSVPAIKVDSEPYKSGIDATQSPGSYWLPFQQPGQYPLSLPPSAHFMPSHIPLFAVPNADSHGPNLHRSGPPFIPYASQASSSQLVEAKFLLPAQAPVPPVMSGSSPSQAYTGDAISYHLGYDTQVKSIQDMTRLAQSRSNMTDG